MNEIFVICISIVLGLLATPGCDDSAKDDPGPDPESFSFRRGKQDGPLYIYPADGRFDFLNEKRGNHVDGVLSADVIAKLRALTTPELQRVYRDNCAADNESCVAQGGYRLSSRYFDRACCYIPSRVTEPRTKEMLDYLIPLFEKYQLESEMKP